MNTVNSRHASHSINEIFLERWSPRAFDGSILPDEDFMRIMEAARWAPSASNSQPWRFLYAKRESSNFTKYVDLLMDGNQRWAKNASVLMFVVSKTFEYSSKCEKRPQVSHSFDTGAAWMALALQAKLLGYYSHGMGGIYKDRIISELSIPDGYHVEAAIALGTLADKSTLPEDLAAREILSDRKLIEEFLFEGQFKAD